MKFFDDIVFDNFANGTTMAYRQNSYFPGYYGLQYIYEGKITASVDGNPSETTSGPVVFFTFPGVPFSYGSPPGTVRKQANVCFAGDRVKSYVKTGLMPLRTQNIFFHIRDSQSLLQVMSELQKSLRIPDEYHMGHGILLLEEMLLQIQYQQNPVASSNSIYWNDFNALRDKIAAEPFLNWDFAKQARLMSLSYSHFRRIFKQVTGWPPRQYLIECRLRYAKGLLISSNKRISEVGQESCFEDEFHFSRIFKKRMGKSPRQFRKYYSIHGK